MNKEHFFIVYRKKYIEDSSDNSVDDVFIQKLRDKIGFGIDHSKVKQFIDIENDKKEFNKFLMFTTENYSNEQVTVVMKSVFDLGVWEFFIVMSSYRVVSILESDETVKHYKDMITAYVNFETNYDLGGTT